MTDVETATLDEERQKSASANTQKIASFIWGIADDVLRDLYVRGKYRDVSCPSRYCADSTPFWSPLSNRSWT